MTRLGRALGSGRLIKQKRGKGEALWVLDWKGADGTRRRQALSRDKRVAERMRIEIISKRDLELAGLGVVEGQSRPLEEVKRLYLADLAARATPKHLYYVRSRVERVLKGVRVTRVRDLLPHHVLAHRTQRLVDGAGYQTVNHEVTNFKAMLRWAADCGLIAESPIQGVKLLPVKQGSIRYQRRAMSDEEIGRFLEAVEEDDRAMDDVVAAARTIRHGTKGPGYAARPRGMRIPQRTLWQSFLETGARYGELTRVTWSDLDPFGRTLVLRGENTKSGKQRTIPLRTSLARDLAALRPVHQRMLGRDPDSGDRIFLTPEGLPWMADSKNALRIMLRILKRADIARKDGNGHFLDIHALRHTCATRLARMGVPITHVQQLLGHSTIELTTRYYTHIGVDDVRRAIERVYALKSNSAAS